MVLCGELTALHAEDVWSRLDSKGRRVCVDFWREKNGVPLVRRYSVDTPVAVGVDLTSQRMVDGWCRYVAPEARQRGDYAEGWMRASGVSCVWVRTDAPDALYWQGRSLAKKLGVPCIEIRKVMRIWDYTGSIAHECGDLAA